MIIWLLGKFFCLIFHLPVRKEHKKGCAENKIAFIDNINIIHPSQRAKARKDLFDIRYIRVNGNDAYAVYYLKVVSPETTLRILKACWRV